jgi:hypothetical protein
MTIAIPEQPTAALTARIEPGQNLITWAQALSSAHQLASALCTTSFVPRHFAGKPEEAAAALMLGDELGLSPISALRSIFVIGGTPGMYAKTMVALVQSRGHEVWTETESATKVTVCGRRAGSDKVEKSEWTLDRARRAGYTNNKKYETTPEDMLYARAAATVCRRIAADVLAGIPHSVEELELEDESKPVRKVQRKAERPTPAEPDLDERPAPPAVTAEQIPAEPALAPETGEALTQRTRGRMFALFTEQGITDRDEQIRGIVHIVGREIGSRSEITETEAKAVIRKLESRIDTALPGADA